MSRLAGKTAIVTGGANGMGEATVRLFVEHGAKVVIGDIQDEAGQALADGLWGIIEETESIPTLDALGTGNLHFYSYKATKLPGYVMGETSLHNKPSSKA